MKNPTKDQQKQENPLLNLLFNIALPVVILNKASKMFGESGPLLALLLALSLPIAYGIYDYIIRKKMNAISALGVLNVAFTGGFALLTLEGHWFAVKEASFPLLIGMAVLVTNFWGRPFLQTIFWNESVFRLKIIEQKIAENNTTEEFKKLFKNATYFFAFTFLFSATANYLLAMQIFSSIDPALPALEKSQLLNNQIADMTWRGYIVIALPMTVFTGLLLWYMVSKLKKLTGLNLEQILNQGEDSPAASSS